MSQQPILNVIAWIVAVAGGLAFCAAGVGFLYVVLWPSSRVLSEEKSLHDTYYVIVHTKTQMWPLLLCMLLSTAIALIGYCRTDYFINRMLRPGLERAEKTLPDDEGRDTSAP